MKGKTAEKRRPKKLVLNNHIIIKKKEKPFTQNNDLNEHKNVEKNST